jgi:hypothetical protein
MPGYLTKAEAVKLILDLAQKPFGEDKRAWRNKINNRLTYNINHSYIPVNEDSLSSLDDILHYAIKEYGVKNFQDYPIPSIKGQLTSGTETVTFNGYAIQLPNNVEELQALAVKQQAEIMQLTEAVAQLESDANQYRKNCETNRNNAKKKPEKNNVHIF